MHPESACLEPDHRHAHRRVDAEILQGLGLLKGPDGVLDGLQQPKCQKDCTGMHGDCTGTHAWGLYRHAWGSPSGEW